MKRTLQRATAITGLLVVSTTSFLAGGAVGFHRGRGFQAGQSSATGAVHLSSNLETIRDNNVESAISSLEAELDGHFLGHALSLLEATWLGEIWRLNAPRGDKLVRVAALYRSEHPRDWGDPDLNSTVDAIVSCLINTSPDLPDAEFRIALGSCYRESW